jgi:hypothetical protein
MPGYDLLSSFHALGFIVFAGHRRFRFRKWSIGNSVGDFTFETLHVNIWVSAAVWNPEPGACATIRWTGWKICWNFVGGEALPRCAMFNQQRNWQTTGREDSLGEGCEDY